MQETLQAGSLIVAVLIAFAAGALSFFSPCVLPLVPGYLAYLGGATAAAAPVSTAADTAQPHSGSQRTARRRSGLPGGVVTSRRAQLLFGVTLFISGFTAVFVTLTIFAGTLGSWLVRYETLITRISGVFLVLLGFVFLGGFGFLQRTLKPRTKPAASIIGAPLLGAVFAVGWTPCIGPTLSVIMALSLQGGSAPRGAVLGVAYCVGLGLPFLLVAAGFNWMLRVTNLARRHIRRINVAGGAALILLGVLMIFGVWTKIMYALQSLIGSVVLPL